MKIIKTDGKVTVAPKGYTFADAQKTVGGLVEVVYLGTDEGVMLVNEEGLIHGLPHNLGAAIIAGQYIAGDAVVLEASEVTPFLDG